MRSRALLPGLLLPALAAACFLAPAPVNAWVGPRVERIRYAESGGFAGTALDLRIYSNGDAILRSGFGGSDRPQTLRLGPLEMNQLGALFTRYRFTMLPPVLPARFPVMDGMQYAVTLFVTMPMRPAGVPYTVRSMTGSGETLGYRLIRQRLHDIAQKVAAQGASGAAGLKASLAARQVGGKVLLEFVVKNASNRVEMIGQQHLNHWGDLEAWAGGQRIWSWSADKMWPMVAAGPKPLQPGQVLRMAGEFPLAGHLPGSGLYATLTFAGYTFSPAVAARKTLQVALPFGGAGGGGVATPGMVDGLDGTR